MTMNKHLLTTGVVRGRQDDDGQPHLSYFDPDSQLAFAWNGHDESPIEVMVDGSNGTVITEISPFPDRFVGRPVWLRDVLTHFQNVCDRYIEEAS